MKQMPQYLIIILNAIFLKVSFKDPLVLVCFVCPLDLNTCVFAWAFVDVVFYLIRNNDGLTELIHAAPLVISNSASLTNSIAFSCA